MEVAGTSGGGGWGFDNDDKEGEVHECDPSFAELTEPTVGARRECKERRRGLYFLGTRVTDVMVSSMEEGESAFELLDDELLEKGAEERGRGPPPFMLVEGLGEGVTL